MANRYPPPYQAPPTQPYGAPESEDRDFLGIIMPKTVVSVAIWIFMFGLGAGVAGLLMFIVYQGQVNSLEGRIIESQEELEDALTDRLDQLEQRETVPAPAASLNVSGASSDRVRDELISNVAPAIVGIQGVDSGGRAINGSGFVVNSSSDQGAWVITNYALVAGAGPETSQVTVRLANSNLIAQVYEVDPGSDLALIVLNLPAPKSLRFTRGELEPGDTVWAFGYTSGRPYATAVEAKLVDFGPSRVTIDADPAVQFNGGPVVDSTGRVVGVLSSRASGSGGAAPANPGSTTRSATPVKLACNVVLLCPGSPRPQVSPSPGSSPSPSASEPTQAPAQPASDGA